MKILLTNDDGVFATGITEMARQLDNHKFDFITVAPSRERSSVGHSITLHRPLRLWEVTNGPYPEGKSVWACDGTPSDSVMLGIEEIEPEISVVVSGINRGPNVGDDLTYSGTVSAAMEGVILGYPSIAVSLDYHKDDEQEHFDTAGIITCSILKWLGENPLEKGVLLNINVPNLPITELKGIKVTRKGVRIYEGKVNRMYDPNGRLFFWISGKPEDQLVEGSDVWAIAHNYVSVTPIHMDMTCFDSLKAVVEGGIEDIPL